MKQHYSVFCCQLALKCSSLFSSAQELGCFFRPSRISRCCDLQHQRKFNQSPRIRGGDAILTNHRNFPANLTNHWRRLELPSTNYLRPYFRVKKSSMCESNVSHLPSKIIAIDRQKQYPGILHESGGKLFCTAYNIVVEHKRKSSIDKHFATAKHNMRCAEMQAGRQTTRQITMTQAVASMSIASSERIKVSYFKCACIVNVKVGIYYHVIALVCFLVCISIALFLSLPLSLKRENRQFCSIISRTKLMK